MLALVLLAVTASGAPKLELELVHSGPLVGDLFEWRVLGAPEPENPFDTKASNLQFRFVGGEKPTLVRAFWFQDYKRALGRDESGRVAEVLEPLGKPEWRLRFRPSAVAEYEVQAVSKTEVAGDTKFRALSGFVPFAGFGRVNAANPLYLGRENSGPKPLIGENACWPGARGTFDYDDWIPKMQEAGMNYTRLWMSPWAFGIEANPGTLHKYALDKAWTLDQVLGELESARIDVVLCLDYHGMLQSQKDFWGSNDNWALNPYNRVNGGPCEKPAEFFTSPEAKRLYRERLEYLVARFGSYPNLLLWEFWNEIDNVRQNYDWDAMVAWHKEMGDVLRELDPYGRPITSSVTTDDHPDFWRAGGLDLVQLHSYARANPGPAFAEWTRATAAAHDKPSIVGEYGADWRGPAPELDPFFHGLRQALWGSLLGGGAGTAQSWWWETLHARNAYPQFRRLADFIAGVPLGKPGWKPMAVSVGVAPSELGEPLTGAEPFEARLIPDPSWGAASPGKVTLQDPSTAAGLGSDLGAFVHGTSKTELRRPFEILAHFGKQASLALHVDSVSDGALLIVRQDGKEIWRRELPDKDGKSDQNGEYDQTFEIPIVPGRHAVSLDNQGPDWAYLNWVEVRGLLPSRKAGGWAHCRAAASGDGRQAVVWIVNRATDWPAGAKDRILPRARSRVLAW